MKFCTNKRFKKLFVNKRLVKISDFLVMKSFGMLFEIGDLIDDEAVYIKRDFSA